MLKYLRKIVLRYRKRKNHALKWLKIDYQKMRTKKKELTVENYIKNCRQKKMKCFTCRTREASDIEMRCDDVRLGYICNTCIPVFLENWRDIGYTIEAYRNNKSVRLDYNE